MNSSKTGKSGSERPPVSESTVESYHAVEASSQMYTEEKPVGSIGGERAGRLAEQEGPVPDFIRRERDWLVGAAKERSRSLLFQKMGSIAAVADDVAEVMHNSARKLGEEEDPTMAHYFQLTAEGLDRLSATFRSRDLETMISRTREFAQFHPALFFGTMATAGFMVSRFLKSSPDEYRPAAASRSEEGPATVTASMETSTGERRTERPYGAVEKPEYGKSI